MLWCAVSYCHERHGGRWAELLTGGDAVTRETAALGFADLAARSLPPPQDSVASNVRPRTTDTVRCRAFCAALNARARTAAGEDEEGGQARG